MDTDMDKREGGGSRRGIEGESKKEERGGESLL